MKIQRQTRKWAFPYVDAGKEKAMYRIINFNQGKGKTLARFNTEEEVVAYHESNQDGFGPSSGDITEKHCIVEFERGTDDCTMLAQFGTSEEAAQYYKTVKDKHEPFGPFLILALELRPDGEYDDLQPKPYNRKTGNRAKK